MMMNGAWYLLGLGGGVANGQRKGDGAAQSRKHQNPLVRPRDWGLGRAAQLVYFK